MKNRVGRETGTTNINHLGLSVYDLTLVVICIFLSLNKFVFNLPYRPANPYVCVPK